MNESTITVRLMKADDFDAVVGIDERILKASRREYYELKFAKLFGSRDYLPASLVAEKEHGTVVGFVMGEIYMGEYGIFQESATLDTIGVDPDYRHKGIGERLIHEFVDHLRNVGVLTVSAAKVAADGGNGKTEASRQKVEYGFLLDRIDMGCDGPAVDQTVENTLSVCPYPAGTRLARFDEAEMGAKEAFHRTIIFL